MLQVRRYLHVVLCFSPVGDKFRIRARQFPALVNCTQLDWFHGWPHEALLSVAQRFLADVPDVTDDVRASMAQFMAQAHQVRHAAGSGCIPAPTGRARLNLAKSTLLAQTFSSDSPTVVSAGVKSMGQDDI